MKRSVLEYTETGIKIVLGGGDIWMTKHEIARLFGCFIAKVVSNIRSILKTGVFDEGAVCRLHRYDNGGFVELYNMEMIIALAFRIKSHYAEEFMEWLINEVIRQHRKRQVPVFISCEVDTLPN